MWSWRGSPKGQGWSGGEASLPCKGATAGAAGKLGQPRADSLSQATSSGRQMFAEVHWSILGKGKGTPRPADAAERRDKLNKDDSDHFDIEEQLRKARTRCQAKLRVLSDLESGLSRLEEETKVLKKKMLRTSEEAKAVRVQYDADMTVIEALNDIRRSQCWRRPEPGGASSSRTATGSSGSSGWLADSAVDHEDRRTRSPANKGLQQTQAANAGSPRQPRKGFEKGGGGVKEANGWAQGGF